MYYAIEFHNQAMFSTEEVNNIVANLVLSSELQSCELPIPQ